MTLSLPIFGRLPRVPNDAEKRERLLAEQRARMDAIVAAMPAVGGFASGITCTDALDRYAEGIQAAYGKG